MAVSHLLLTFALSFVLNMPIHPPLSLPHPFHAGVVVAIDVVDDHPLQIDGDTTTD
jgi:hypothetical protein